MTALPTQPGLHHWIKTEDIYTYSAYVTINGATASMPADELTRLLHSAGYTDKTRKRS